MTKSLRILLLTLLAVAMLAPSGILAMEDAVLQESGGHETVLHRCGTPDLSAFELERNALAIERWVKIHGTARDKSNVTIPIAFHSIAMDDGTCDVTDAQIYDQLDVMNAAYADYGFQFVIASIDRWYNTKWSTARYGTKAADDMKASTSIDPAHNFNVWSANIGGGLLGYSTFPSMYPEDDYRHGCVILYSSLPGGSAYPYNEGDTLTHESGHYLGLYHTFQGGCTEPNDYCDDTPQEQSAAYGCPADDTDTCPNDPGYDPIHNYMDYVDDPCMWEFTTDQATRMYEQMSLYRPTIMGGITGVAPTAAFNGTPTSGNFPLTVAFTDQSAGSPTSWAWNFGDGGTSTAQNPSHTYANVGLYSVTLTVSNEYGTDDVVRTDYINVTDPSVVVPSMHVADIVVYRELSGSKYYIHGDVLIQDENGAPVEAASVCVMVTGAISGGGCFATAADGWIRLTSTSKTSDMTITCFEVTDVTHATLAYDEAANLVTKSCEDGDVFRDGVSSASGIAGIQPNPFNPCTKISFYMEREGMAKLEIYDLSGKLVATLFDGRSAAGEQSFNWDARRQSSGVYFCRFQTQDKVETQKLTLLK